MDVDDAKATDATTAAAAAAGEKDAAAAAAAAKDSPDSKDAAAAAASSEGSKDKESKDKEKEASKFTMTAPCRVVPLQVKHVSLPPGEAGGGAMNHSSMPHIHHARPPSLHALGACGPSCQTLWEGPCVWA